jgi:microcin C transport system substrate-binding protein
MNKTIGFFMLSFIVSAFFGNLKPLQAEPKAIRAYSIALHGQAKYSQDFNHFEYVNPEAPKGGLLVRHAIGTYDNFHRFAQRGLAAVASGQLYDTLMVASEDEVEVYYPLIAQQIEYPTNHNWVIFHINPAARHQDAKPITAHDVVFSFNKFFNEGVPQFKQYYKGVKSVAALDRLRVKFELKTGDKKMLLSLSGLAVLPAHFWKQRNFAEPLTEIPTGSGAYTVADFKMGQYVLYQRIKNYWAKNLPVNKGRFNFDAIRYDYYRDQTVAFEAFKAGEYDIRQENIAKNWATLYKGPAFENGQIIKQEIPHQIPQPMQAFVFNTKRLFFKDRRVRMAINYALDFQWMNKNLFYSQYTRTRSYFQNTIYEAKGLPDAQELKLLKSLNGKIPDEVFNQTYQPPVTNGSGNIRPQLRKALRLLKAAGWIIKNKRLVNEKTDQPMEFELLLYSPSTERIAIPFKNNLKRLGITLTLRLVDTTQFVNRIRKRDFDMISGGYSAHFYPSDDLKIVWHSKYLDFTYNMAGVADSAVDALINGISANQQNLAALLTYGRVLDRVLTWNHYVVPQWHLSKFRVAYWNKFSRPSIRPKYNLGIDTWWLDTQKAKKLKK